MSERITYVPMPVEATLEISVQAQAGERPAIYYRPKDSTLPWTRVAHDDPRIPDLMRLAGWEKKA